MNSSARSIAIRRAQSLVALKPVYLDTETTGLKEADQIIDICIVDHDGTILLDSLVNPTRPISFAAGRVHGISTAQVQSAPSWAELWPRVSAILTNRAIAIYNAEFDWRLMQQSHQAHQLRWSLDAANASCVMKLYAEFVGEWNRQRGDYRWHTLERAAQQCRIAVASAHRAQVDALTARAVLHYMAGARGT